jgi:hypothetical protein
MGSWKCLSSVCSCLIFVFPIWWKHFLTLLYFSLPLIKKFSSLDGLQFWHQTVSPLSLIDFKHLLVISHCLVSLLIWIWDLFWHSTGQNMWSCKTTNVEMLCTLTNAGQGKRTLCVLLSMSQMEILQLLMSAIRRLLIFPLQLHTN